MRWRPLTWLLLSMLFFVGAAFFWRLGEKWAAEAEAQQHRKEAQPQTPAAHSGRHSNLTQPIQLLSSAATLNSVPKPATTTAVASTNAGGRFPYRLSNTTKTSTELGRSDHSLLLENALLDTAQPIALSIPEQLRSKGDPGSYIVQAKEAINGA